MTTGAVTGKAPEIQPSSSFVAVAATAAYDTPELTSSRRPERRATSRRLHDAAVLAVLETSGYAFAVLALSLFALAGCEWVVVGPLTASSMVLSLAAAVAAAAGLWLARRRPGRDTDTRRMQWRIGWLGGSLSGVMALVPWVVDVQASPVAGPMWLTFVLGICAVACSYALAPLRHMAIGVALLPVPSALASLAAGTPVASMQAVASALSVAVAAMVGNEQYRRWHAAVQLEIERADRIRALEVARDGAIKADQEKSRFLAIASHDLRQPVHAIGLFAATLEKRLEGSAEEPLVRNLSRAIDGLDRSFNVMLDISRLDAGAIEPRVQQFPLRDLFRRLHMHFAGQAEEKGLGLRFSPGGKSISSDPQLLERILGNLVQNAIKYTEHGGIVVVARSTRTHTHVEIWDTGIGIRAGDLKRVFDEFYQVGRGERVRTQGLGMGLAIVKRLMRLLGHDLIVSSRLGRGTMFRLRIALGGLPDIQEVTAAADTLPLPILQPRTVLVIDDEEPIRDGLCLLLQEWGYEAIAAGSMAEAEDAVSQLETPPDLILSDLHLGDGPDGIAAIEAIRRLCGCEVAAMLITGDTSHAEIRRATESGHPVLFKPVQPRKLYDALRGMTS